MRAGAEATTDKSQGKYARLAGFMFLFGVAAYMSGHTITSRFAVPDDFAATGQKLAVSYALYRVGLALMLVTSWGTILLAGALYALLKPVDPVLALLALLWRVGETILGAMAVVIRFVRLENHVAAARGGDVDGRRSLGKLIDAGFLSTFNVATLFFTAGSTLFFYLLLRTRFLPRALSAFGLVSSILLATLAAANLILPKLPPQAEYLGMPMLVAEIAAGFWLLFAGVNPKHGSDR
jgi:hypothetical protein